MSPFVATVRGTDRVIMNRGGGGSCPPLSLVPYACLAQVMSKSLSVKNCVRFNAAASIRMTTRSEILQRVLCNQLL